MRTTKKYLNELFKFTKEDYFSGTVQENVFETGLDELAKWAPILEEDRDSNVRPTYQVIDFFSGCGGMSLGFSALGQAFNCFEIIGGVDINKQAGQTFEKNFKAPCIMKDIRKIKTEKHINELLASFPRYNSKIPKIIIGCAPCQGFSSHRKKHWGTTDERNSLISHFAKVAVKMKPECIVMENVPELLSNKYWHEFEAAQKVFFKNGYIVKQAIYNAAEFGVPQERFRAVVVAMKKEFQLPKSFIKRSEFVTVKQAIGALPKINPGEAHAEDVMHRSAKHNKTTIETIKAIPKNGGSRPQGVGPKCLDKVKGFYDVYGRLSWDKPAVTITHYARNPASGRYVHPVQHRGLSAREAALLQSFPKDFMFLGTFDAVFKQIGEAVPPKLSVGIASNILIELISKKQEIPSDANKKEVLQPVSNSYSSVIAGIKRKRQGEQNV